MSFSVKSFIALSEAYLQKLKSEWVIDMEDSLKAPYALQYAREKDWLMPNETLEQLGTFTVFKSVDVANRAMAVKKGTMTELQAKLAISADARKVLAEAGETIEGLSAPNSLQRLIKLHSDERWDEWVEAMERGLPPLHDFLETWGSACGAPRAVFRGHLCMMLRELMPPAQSSLRCKDTADAKAVPGEANEAIEGLLHGVTP